ncbi:reverse transcriptase domain-containing protein, partial [Bartonella sp. CB14SXKL]|uniref:reverse transcriptase domain-containing protein n=1 Tax=Bartonella sp. CB14SXKL TaxID=3243511 RepID=UPI0035D10D76
MVRSEFYVDDLVVKSRKEIDHFKDLKMVFERCRKYQLRMNPMKCVFGVTRGKFLGFVVNRHEVAIDEDKKRAIMEMERPKSQKQLKSFLGRISYLRRFIPALAEISHPLSPLIKNNMPFKWNEDHQLAFDNIKKVLSSTSTMCPPKQGQ